MKEKNEISLLLGNGINRLAIVNISWEELLRQVSRRLDYSYKENDKEKPLPLLFEEIILRNNKDYKAGQLEAKRIIAEELIMLHTNEFHKSIKNLGFETILTTNYDYLIEKGIDPSFTREDMGSVTREQTHSIYRKIHIENISIWHIHGEVNDFKNGSPQGSFRPHSILIGFDQYANYLREIQKYAKENEYRADRKGYERKSIFSRIRDNDKIEIKSWIDCFFFTDLVILGLSLAFIEIDIWWIFTFRSVYVDNILGHKKLNKIYYLIPCFERQNNESKQDLLSALGVKIVEIHANNYEDFFNKSFDLLKGKEFLC